MSDFVALVCACGHLMKDHVEGFDSCSLCECGGFQEASRFYPNQMVEELIHLLDRIEIEDAAELSRQRFQILEKYGFEVEIAGELVSGALN